MLPHSGLLSSAMGVSGGLDSPQAQPPLVGTVVIGTPGSPSYRVMFASEASSLVSPWHDIPLLSTRGGFSCVCTTPAGSWVKYCLADEPLDPLRVQREMALPAVPRLSSSYLSSSPRTPSFHSPTSPITTSPFSSSLTCHAVSPSSGTVGSRPTSPFYPHHADTSPLSQCSDPRYSGRPRTPFSAFSASFSSDEGERSLKDTTDLLALDVIGRPAHFTENTSWHCGFLPQTSVLHLPSSAENYPQSGASSGSPKSRLVSHLSYKSPCKKPSDDSCLRTLSVPANGDTWQQELEAEDRDQRPRSRHPTIRIPPPADAPSRDCSPNRSLSVRQDVNRPLDVIELGCYKERSPGEVFEVRPLASFVWKPDGVVEVPLAIVVMAMDNPIEPLLEDGDFFQELVPRVLGKMQVWLEKQQSLNSEEIGGESIASTIRLETSTIWTAAAMSKSHKAWKSQYEHAILRTPPISLPLMDEATLTCLWDKYTRGSSSHIAHMAIPLSQPKGPPKSPKNGLPKSPKNGLPKSPKSPKDQERTLTTSRSCRWNDNSSNGYQSGLDPSSHPKSPFREIQEDHPLKNSRSWREGRRSIDGSDSDVDSIPSCSDATLSPRHRSQFAFSTSLDSLKSYLPQGPWSAKGGLLDSPTKSEKTQRRAAKVVESPTELVESGAREKSKRRNSDGGASPTTLTGIFERRTRDKGARTLLEVAGRPQLTQLHILRSSACEHDYPIAAARVSGNIGVEMRPRLRRQIVCQGE